MFNEGRSRNIPRQPPYRRRKAFVRHLAYVVMPDHCHFLLYPREAIYGHGQDRRLHQKPVAEQAFKLYHRNGAKSIKVSDRQRADMPLLQQGGGYDPYMSPRRDLGGQSTIFTRTQSGDAFVVLLWIWPWSSASFYEVIAIGDSPFTILFW